MATYAIKWLKNIFGTKFFPITHVKAVRDDNNVNVETLLNAKQATLVSGSNIKTINGESVLGSGNISVSSAGGGDVNVIESISVNGTTQEVDTNKNVDIDVPTKVSDLTNDAGYITGYTETDPIFSASAAAGITSSDITNWNGKTSNIGTITSVKMNGTTVSSSGEADLGTVITSHQDISGKADKSATVSTVTYNTTSKKITKTINGTTTDVVTAATIVTDGGGITTETDPTVPSWAKASSKPSYTASEVGAVPTTRKVNGKALSADITLSASDVSALPSSTVIPDELSDLSDDATHRLVTDTEKSTWNNKQNALTFDGTYNASTNKAATVSTVTNAINALDGGTIGTGGAGKTITSLSQTNGNVSATFADISITKSQVSDFPTSMTPASHTHGNISNTGTMTDTAAAAAGNDYVVIRDADNAKVQTSTIKGTDVADAVSKKHSHSTITLSTTAQAYDGSHTLALPSTDPYTSARTPSAHNQASSTINAMTGYSKGSSSAAVAATDSLNTAISKLENQIDTKTSNTGTITGVSVNGTSVATSGVANITSVPASILSGAIANGVTATTQSSGDNSTKVATTAYVDTAVNNLPEPMIFKGSLGTGGTITSLPSASSSNEGYTYKVITAGTYASQAAKVGDTFISDGSAWVLIPSGDEPSGTVTSVTIKATSPIAIDSNAAITTSGERTLSHANSGVTAGTYKSVTVNETGHVTAGTNPTTLSGYGITDANINNGTITLGSDTITPLTSFTETDPVFAASAAHGISSSDITNWNSKTDNVGTITGITMNGASKGTSGVVDLGTVITEHQDISGKADKATTLAGYGITNAYTKSNAWYMFVGLSYESDHKLSSGSDLNNFKLSGTYFCEQQYSSSILNRPSNSENTTFYLWVYDYYDSTSDIGHYYNQGAVIQRYKDLSNRSYERIGIYVSSDLYWFEWVKVEDNLNTYALSANVYTKADVYTKTDSNSRFYALSGVTYTSGSSIDVTTLDAGTYYISSVDKLIDPPTESYNGLSTYFWVLKPNNRHTIIRLQISDSPNIWEKYYMASSGWSNWVLVQDDLSKYALSAGSSSDARLKDKVDDINLNVEDIAKAPNLTFKWKNGKDNNLHGGTYAQYWENITPYYVHGDDSKSIEYGNLALTCSIELAKEIVTLKNENAQLKKELSEIKEVIHSLNK